VSLAGIPSTGRLLQHNRSKAEVGARNRNIRFTPDSDLAAEKCGFKFETPTNELAVTRPTPTNAI
jgi:hypothetical protein